MQKRQTFCITKTLQDGLLCKQSRRVLKRLSQFLPEEKREKELVPRVRHAGEAPVAAVLVVSRILVGPISLVHRRMAVSSPPCHARHIQHFQRRIRAMCYNIQY